ncbi:MAG: hypothetical protein ACOYJZ_04260 [Acutalibacter sp.]
MGKSLYIASSVYHLLTEANLRWQESPRGEADLLLTNATPGLPDLADRARQSGLFSRVLPVRIRELAQRFPMDRGEAASCFREWRTHLRWILGEDLGRDYDQVYFPNFDWLTRLLALVLDCPFYWVEDGFSSYVIDFLREDRAAVNRLPETEPLRRKLTAALLYEPGLAMRGDGLANRPLPKLSREDGELRKVLNFLFDYHPPRWMPSFLFLEQSFRAEGIRGNDLELMALCRETVGPERFGVKSHPRNEDCLAQNLGLSRPLGMTGPWELFLLNERNLPKVVTVCSNGALSARLCLGLDEDTVLLYRLYNGKVLWKENDTLTRFLESYRRRYGGKRTYVPETKYQLQDILHHLGGESNG